MVSDKIHKNVDIIDNDDIDSILKDFRNFVINHKYTGDDSSMVTHTIMKKGGGSYRFEGLDYQMFLKKYTQIIKLYPEIIKEYEDYILQYVEKPNPVTFLFIDIDYDHKGKKRLYNIDHVKQIIEKANEFIKENFIVNDYELTAFITEKISPTDRDKDNLYKDGFHIYYPYLPLATEYRYYILDYLSSLMVNDELLEGIPYKNNSDTIFDMRIIKSNGILMIGSQKEKSSPYNLTHIYDHNLEDLDTKAYDIEDLIYTLSNRQYDEDSSVLPCNNKTIINNIKIINDQYGGGNKKKKIKERNSDKDHIDSNVSSKINKKKLGAISATSKRDIALAKKLTTILKKSRASEYTSWQRTGFVLRSIDDSLYDDFVTFSKQDKGKFNDGKITCKDIWKAAENYQQFYSIGTLRHWARLDNSEQFYKIVAKHNDELFGQAESAQHADIAQIIYELYKDRFVCIDIQKNKWYEFQSHRWVLVQSAYTLQELISGEIRKMLRMYCAEKIMAAATSNNNNDFNEDNDTKRYTKLLKEFNKLGNVGFRKNLIEACANKFYDDKFQGKLDSNVYLVGFLNGVYDLKEQCFRDGLPTDCVSKTVGYDWIEYDEDDEVFEKINKFFSEVQTDDDLREYLMTVIAKSLRGIPDTKLHIWTGGGGNGKSATIDLIKNMLGDYFGVVPVTLLTRKQGSSSNATPELADKNGKRFLVIQEPEHNDVLFVGQMKGYTGKDLILARPLYGDPFYYTPQFIMVLTCNNLPYIPAQDKGTWRRLRVTPFESEFVDEMPTGPKQFLKDEDLQEEFPEWVQPMMWMIITKYYPIYAKGINGKAFKIIEPAKVKEYTANYKADSDVMGDFLDVNLNKTGDDKNTEPIAFLFDTFRVWYQASYSDRPPDRKKFIAYLKTNGYKVDDKGTKIFGVEYAIGLS